MTEKQARLAPAALYLGPDGRLHTIGGVAHLEDEEGRIEVETLDGLLVLVRAEIRGQRQ